MARKWIVIVVFIIVAIAGISIVTILNGYPPNGDNNGFDNGGRYDDSILNTMGVIYANRADNYAFNEGYSTTAACPWGFIHLGIDYFLKNNSKVIAAAPGKVVRIEWLDLGENASNRFLMHINIQFNESIIVCYGFEPWTNKSSDKDKQLALFSVGLNEWVVKGQEIGRFLRVGDAKGDGHIHFDVQKNYVSQ